LRLAGFMTCDTRLGFTQRAEACLWRVSKS
jgi:hypothetical protein